MPSEEPSQASHIPPLLLAPTPFLRQGCCLQPGRGAHRSQQLEQSWGLNPVICQLVPLHILQGHCSETCLNRTSHSSLSAAQWGGTGPPGLHPLRLQEWTSSWGPLFSQNQSLTRETRMTAPILQGRAGAIPWMGKLRLGEATRSAQRCSDKRPAAVRVVGGWPLATPASSGCCQPHGQEEQRDSAFPSTQATLRQRHTSESFLGLYLPTRNKRSTSKSPSVQPCRVDSIFGCVQFPPGQLVGPQNTRHCVL